LPIASDVWAYTWVDLEVLSVGQGVVLVGVEEVVAWSAMNMLLQRAAER